MGHKCNEALYTTWYFHYVMIFMILWVCFVNVRMLKQNMTRNQHWVTTRNAPALRLIFSVLNLGKWILCVSRCGILTFLLLEIFKKSLYFNWCLTWGRIFDFGQMFWKWNIVFIEFVLCTCVLSTYLSLQVLKTLHGQMSFKVLFKLLGK